MVATLFAVFASASHSQTHSPLPKSAVGSGWHLLLAHDANGKVEQGDHEQIVNAVRQGCQIRIAWGNKGPTSSIEHIADPMWISIRNGNDIEIQIGGFLVNQNVLGEPPEDHPKRERFGGTEKVVEWRASLRTNGTFNAVWFYPHNGEFITRVPQRHPMRWFADCDPVTTAPLFPTSNEG